MSLPSLDDYFPDWKEREALAEGMIPMIGQLYRNNVVVYCYGRAMHNQSVTQLMKAHRYVRQVEQNELSEFETYPVLEAISKLDLAHATLILASWRLNLWRSLRPSVQKILLFANVNR